LYAVSAPPAPLEWIKLLVANGAVLNQDMHGWNLLHLAAAAEEYLTIPIPRQVQIFSSI
jgi:hypothetical protein